MSVDVAIGRALYEITNTNLTPSKTYKVYHDSDAVENVIITAADATNPRIDIIVMKCDVSQNPNSSSGNIPSIIAVAGTPAGSPAAPAVPANCLKIGQVAVAAGAASIVTANITDSRTYVTINASVFADLQREATAIKTTRAQFADFTAKTIATGAITVTQPLHTVDTQGAASTDDLDTITAAYGSGELIHLRAADTSRTIVVKHNTGNIKLADAADFSLDDTEKSITLIRNGSTWYEICRGVGSPSSAVYSKVVYLGASDSGTIGTSDTTLVNFDTHTYTIPANALTATVWYEVEGVATIGWAAGTVDIVIKLGATTMATARAASVAESGNHVFRATIAGTAVAGAAAAVRVGLSDNYGSISSGAGRVGADYGVQNVATNGTLAITIAHQFSASNAGNSAILKMLKVTKCSTVAFT